MKKLAGLIVSILIPLAVGFLSSTFTQKAGPLYEQLKLPSFAPPSNVFPVVWSILYVLMGVSAYLVYLYGNNDTKSTALVTYFTQLFFNFLWSIVFFGFELYWAAFVVLIVLVYFIINMILAFSKENKLSAYLQIPYLLWVVFAGILNVFIAIMN